uniref:Uncharacterized protein n=1 Tax=Cucumis melo TaxID=3656 RepID=A0A9I9EIN1_CUCME
MPLGRIPPLFVFLEGMLLSPFSQFFLLLLSLSCLQMVILPSYVGTKEYNVKQWDLRLPFVSDNKSFMPKGSTSSGLGVSFIAFKGKASSSIVLVRVAHHCWLNKPPISGQLISNRWSP